jgi:uracil-DNA glycosylase family 4
MPSPKMNPRIQLQVRNADCIDCRMHSQAEGQDRCVTATGSHTASLLVVSKMPFGDRSLKEMQTYLERVGFDIEDCAFSSAIKCRSWDMSPNRTDIKACKEYLAEEIKVIKPDWVLALGNEALTATAGKSGIMKHRGITYQGPHGSQVMATISPAMVHRNPGQKGGFEADLIYLHNQMSGVDIEAANKPEIYQVADNKQNLQQMLSDLRNAHGVSFDIESTGFDEFAPDSCIVCIAFTLWNERADSPQMTWALPLYHPHSPWRSSWQKILNIVGPVVSSIPRRIAHNGKFDCRWLRHFGWDTIDQTFDTMLAAHILDENRPKGLKPLARQLLSAPPWAMDTKNLLEDPLDEVLLYCGLDTHHAARLYFIFRNQLKSEPRKAKIFSRLLVPASNEFIDTERSGVWVDRPLMMTNWRIAESELEAINTKLREYVPDSHPFVKDYRDGSKDIEANINFGPSNFLRWFLFEYLELPIILRGKDKDNGSPGSPSVSESVMLELKGQHPAVDLLLERTKWYKYTTAFFSAYAEQLDSNSRIHTSFKVTGTVTGRLSSGKADTEKVTSRAQIRGVNLQQVPRDKFVRSIFGAPPGSAFVEFDYSQVELRIAAFLAREQTILSLYSQGADIHMAMAMRMTGKPASEVSTHERKMAKAVNFGFLYGMGARKFIQTALSNYQIHVSLEEAEAARTAFFTQFPGLLPWHARQRSLAAKYKRVETPLGRVRHLPDIDSPDRSVRSEAERQAINSPVQGLASDLALISFVRVSREFRKRNLSAHPIGTVHDAVNYEIPIPELPICLPIIKSMMEDTKYVERVFGLQIDVPIIADCKIGLRWGGAQEVPAEMIDDPNLKEYILSKLEPV